MNHSQKAALVHALSIRDLTDPSEGPHAIQLVVDRAVAGLVRAWQCPTRTIRSSPLVTVSDNYDELGYPPDAVTRDKRYTRYAGEGVLLRTQTSALVPPALRALARERPQADDVLLVCPGIVYRRDQIDRLHTGEPHQLDLWRIRRGPPLGDRDLMAMIAAVVGAVLPDRAWRTQAASHPYTSGGLQIDLAAADPDRWIEIGECGVAATAVLERAGLEGYAGLAMGLGLDRLVMLLKGIDDIRLLRSAAPRVRAQMEDLAPYRRVSTMPPIRRDLSIATARSLDVELLGDRVREALGTDADLVEEVALLSDTPYALLPSAAAARLGMSDSQRNLLVRVVLRAVDRTLTHDEASALRDRIYAALHEGSVHTWALGPPASTTPAGNPV
jgi:phenylalanyl-tRNA synthetase alpha chain